MTDSFWLWNCLQAQAIRCVCFGVNVQSEYDIFISHAWADGERPRQIAQALRDAGLRVWFDADVINDFESITKAVTAGLARSKVLLAYYSKKYPLRRACQWELTAAFLAAQLEGDPRRRILVINPERASDHIHPVELRDAKFRQVPSTDAEMRELADTVRATSLSIQGPLADIHPLTPPNWYGTTPVGSTVFVGRFEQMWMIHSLLHAGDAVQISGARAAAGGIGQVTGLGGVGKSLLVEEYALHFGAAYPGGIIWLRAYGERDSNRVLNLEECELLRADQVERIAQRLGIKTDGLTNEQIESALARDIENRRQPCLWVVDDVPGGLNATALRRWFAPHTSARTLITTRSREYGSLAKSLDLSVLHADESYELITCRRSPIGQGEKEEARLLAADLGHHALALDVTSAALVSYGNAQPYRTFRDELASIDKDILELAAELADVLPNGHEANIAQTLMRSVSSLGEEGLDFLRMASVLAPAPISGSIVTSAFALAKNLEFGLAEIHQRKAFHEVTIASLADISGESLDSRTVHSLVSRVIRFHEKSCHERTQKLRSAAVEIFRHSIARVAEDPNLHKQIEFDIVHARLLVSRLETTEDTYLVSCVAGYDYSRGAYASMRQLCERSAEFCRRVLGSEDPVTILSLHNLAVALDELGNLVSARSLKEEVLDLRRRLLGLEEPDTLSSMNNLAETMAGQGDLLGARRLQEETLELRRKILGTEHPDTLTSMHNLSLVMRAQGDLEQAQQLQFKTLEAQRRLRGVAHPKTLISMSQLAETLRLRGDIPGATQINSEAIALMREVLGSEHPTTLNAMNNFAHCLKANGDLAAAKILHEEILAVQRKTVGEEHPATLTSKSNLAEVLLSLGEVAAARPMLEEVVAISSRVLGAENPATLTSLNNLAGALSEQGDADRALELYRRILGIQRHTLGQDHPDTIRSMSNLSYGLYVKGELQREARRFQEMALSVARSALGVPAPIHDAHCVESDPNP